jgi:hypothetical protein
VALPVCAGAKPTGVPSASAGALSPGVSVRRFIGGAPMKLATKVEAGFS